MARNTAGMIDLSGLDDLRERASYLGRYAWADALQTAMNELSKAAVDHLADDWSGAIAGGPVAFANVSRKLSSAVRAVTRKGATKGVAEASVEVKPRQSAFLEFGLGEAQDREPGDVGAAEAFNFIPVQDALKERLGIRLTRQGNLPRNALSRLSDAARASRVGKNLQGWDGLGRFQATARGDAGGAGVFFGAVTRKGGKRVRAFWSRGGERGARLRALAFAVERSRYQPKLVPVWNGAMKATEADLPAILRPILERIIDRRFARGTEARSRKAANARAERAAESFEGEQRKARETDTRSPEVVAAERKARKRAYDQARAEARRKAKGGA